MNEGVISDIIKDCIVQLLMLSAPVLIIGMVVGLIVSIFQATTSIQDQTLTFVPKIIAIFGALVFFGPWMLLSAKEFTMSLLKLIPELVRM